MSEALLRVRVKPDAGDSYVVEVMSRDVLRWEKAGRDRSYQRLMEQQDMVPMYELAWHTATRLGLFTGSLAAFESTCDITGVPDDEETQAAGDPTQPARSAGPRSRSR